MVIGWSLGGQETFGKLGPYAVLVTETLAGSNMRPDYSNSQR
jgi:hypothetical protein